MWAILSQRIERSLRLASNNHSRLSTRFWASMHSRGNKILRPAFWYEAATCRSSRRLSRIAKGPLTRCSERALARIAKGGGLIDGYQASVTALGHEIVAIETPEPATRPGMAERAIDTATDMSRTITEVSAALGAAVDRLSQTIATARQPGKPLSTISGHYPGGSAHELVYRVPVRGRDSATALDKLLFAGRGKRSILTTRSAPPVVFHQAWQRCFRQRNLFLLTPVRRNKSILPRLKLGTIRRQALPARRKRA